MGKCGDCLHLNCVTLLQWSVKEPWCVDDLPWYVVIVSMSYVQALGSERVITYLHLCVGNSYHEGRFAYVWVASDYKCPGMGVDAR